MGRLKHSVLVLGEGPTEFYYFNSLRDVVKGLNIKPDYPKHTKDTQPERTQYARLKKKYARPVSKPKKGIYCEIRFFETHRCTEQFFLYYFRYTARAYNDQSELLLDLNKQCGYEKTVDFFRKSKGLHAYFEKKGGRLDTAVHNSKHSMEERLVDGRQHTYSELGSMIDELKALL